MPPEQRRHWVRFSSIKSVTMRAWRDLEIPWKNPTETGWVIKADLLRGHGGEDQQTAGLAQLLNRAGIETVVLQRKSPNRVLSRNRAGVLERITVDLLRRSRKAAGWTTPIRSSSPTKS